MVYFLIYVCVIKTTQKMKKFTHKKRHFQIKKDMYF